jgi:hypothetical protein
MWAASWFRNKGQIPLWIADFRDPIDYEKNSTAISRFVYSRIQRNIVALSDEVVAASEGIAAKLNNPIIGKRPIILYNGFDPEDLFLLDRPHKNADAERVLRLAYVGSLYGGARDISIIFAALAGLLKSGRMKAGGVQFEYAGNDFRVLLDQASGFGLESILVNHGSVIRKKSLEIQSLADIVVVATWNSAQDQGVVPGKLFECFMLRKPVLGVVRGSKPNSEFKSIVERVGAGVVYEQAGDETSQLRALMEFLDEKQLQLSMAGEVSDEYNDCVSDYAYPNHAKTISQLVNGLRTGT